MRPKGLYQNDSYILSTAVVLKSGLRGCVANAVEGFSPRRFESDPRRVPSLDNLVVRLP